jgi:hypothetical protein
MPRALWGQHQGWIGRLIIRIEEGGDDLIIIIDAVPIACCMKQFGRIVTKAVKIKWKENHKYEIDNILNRIKTRQYLREKTGTLRKSQKEVKVSIDPTG